VAQARALMRRTEKGKAYGAVTANALAVLAALLWGFHNAASGRCFPSYETIADGLPTGSEIRRRGSSGATRGRRRQA
jgi:hypothetical protein